MLFSILVTNIVCHTSLKTRTIKASFIKVSVLTDMQSLTHTEDAFKSYGPALDRGSRLLPRYHRKLSIYGRLLLEISSALLILIAAF